MPKKNILILIEIFGPGGAEKAATMLAQMIHESGQYNVWMCSVYKSSDAFHDTDVERRSLNINPATSIFRKLSNYVLKIRRLRKLKKTLSIDLTISSLWPADWINVLSGKEKKISVIQINILNNLQNLAMVRYKRFVRAIYNKFDKIAIVSSYLAHELTDFFKVNKELITVIHNPIDARRLDKNIREALPEGLETVFSRYKVLISANRLHEIKNTEALIYIVKRLRTANIKLMIAGSGDEEKKLKAVIHDEGLIYSDLGNAFDPEADIYFTGFRANIHNMVSRSKVFLLPTKGEGFPLGLLEAMYCGVPVVVSDCPNGGVFEIMQGKGQYNMNNERLSAELTQGGFLMPIPYPSQPERISLWVDRILEIINAEESVLSSIKQKNRSRALEFDKEALKQKWFDTIEELLQK